MSEQDAAGAVTGGEQGRRPRLTPAVADVRRAVREQLESCRESGMLAAGHAEHQGSLVLVALSGGADSLALAVAAAFEAPRAGMRAGAVIIDHQLQADSAEVAERAAGQARALGLDPVITRRVEVTGAGGPEATARQARYAALTEVADETGAAAVLLAHTLDDQAETVLLGLARGSGSTSLAGMAPVNGIFVRPLLGIHRRTTVQACADVGLEPWHDPHNDDPSYTRVRVRKQVLPVLEAELGPGIAGALARSAEQAREDHEAFEGVVAEALDEVLEPCDGGVALAVTPLAAHSAAIRNRIIRSVVFTEFDVSLSREHTLAIAALVTNWHGQGELQLPGMRVQREGDVITLRPAPATSPATVQTTPRTTPRTPERG